MGNRQAIDVALMIYRRPTLVRATQEAPLPEGMLTVIRIAAGAEVEAGIFRWIVPGMLKRPAKLPFFFCNWFSSGRSRRATGCWVSLPMQMWSRSGSISVGCSNGSTPTATPTSGKARCFEGWLRPPRI